MSRLVGLTKPGINAPFKIDLIQANKERHNLIQFNQRRFYSCVFVDCEFTECVFEYLQFHDCRFVRCKFTKCHFNNVQMTGKTSMFDCIGVRNRFEHSSKALITDLQAWELDVRQYTTFPCIVSKYGKGTMIQLGRLFYSLSYWKKNFRQFMNTYSFSYNIGEKAAKDLLTYVTKAVNES